MMFHPDTATIFQSQAPNSHFFGYYDLLSLDRTGKRLLAHRTNFDGRDITVDDVAEVGWFDLRDSQWHAIGTTGAFNWQQGARLQWLPPDFGRRILHNDCRKNQFVAVIHDLHTLEETVLPCPVYGVHPSGDYALAVNYERFHFCRPGYNYQGVINDKWDCPIHAEDGIALVDLHTGKTTQLVATQEICDIDHRSDMDGRNHWLECPLWNPSGTRFAFLHRWDDGMGGHVTRLFTADIDGKSLFMYPDSGFYSHMNWRTDDTFVIWGRRLNPIVRGYLAGFRGRSNFLQAMLPAYRWIRDHIPGAQDVSSKMSGQSYLEFREYFDQGRVLAPASLCVDGHMSFHPGHPNLMLADTYEDAEQLRHLFVYDFTTKRTVRLGSFFSPYNRSTFRCDLHPRWSQDGRSVVCDSAHQQGRRQLYVLDVADRLAELLAE